ncbi:hypothetical protein [Actinoplanes derwentensis]|uniref:Uncharacterized protein n=1 Tax=Actinoplanes derwentensis TaxID=113562 RepID=A0A1H1WB78_9ACTN|nr:hypothetical protein [Actinoplanes derwentensis]GID87378.1 hypothetical protein Ade03nite_63020 [Actinoplanes derwentensis]SDS94487.1 hypothetical protein SAMN04489716_2051 [Actinoplanes derwentensis]
MNDDDLRELLRHADPATSLQTAAPDQVRQLTEEAMSRTHARRWALPATAAAFVLLAGSAAWAATRPSDVPAVPVAKAPATVVELTSDGGGDARCDPRPDPVGLAANADFAFEGTVIKLVDGDGTEQLDNPDETSGVVTLAVTKVFKGPQAGTVQVAQQSTTNYAGVPMVGSGTFDLGKSYLVASTEGSVWHCFQSGEADDPGLRALYEAAF